MRATNLNPQIDLHEYDFSHESAGPVRYHCTSSPCKKRPDTGVACPLVAVDKNNRYCYSCLFVGNGSDVHDSAELSAAKNIITRVDAADQCDFPGCHKASLKKSRYCQEHADLVSTRRNNHLRYYGCPATEAYLHKPKANRGRYKPV